MAAGVWTCLVLAVVPVAGQESGASDLTSGLDDVDALWHALDRTYALLEEKRVPWKAVRRSYLYGTRTVNTASDRFELAAEMLSLLNDNHIKLTGWTGIVSVAGDLRDAGPIEDYSSRVVREGYLVSPAEERARGTIAFGWLPDSVAYVHVASLDDDADAGTALDEALDEFADARGLVLDLRRNLGGDDDVGRALASRFGDRPRRYMTTRLKSGPGPGEFTAPKHWILTPPAGGGYVRPIVVLIHGLTFSAGENLALALRTLPHATLVGTETSGSMGETLNDVLPNGWVYRTVVQRIVDAEGRSWEGVGVRPDLRVANRPAEIQVGRDRALETAAALLVNGGNALVNRDGSVDRASRSFRLPLADSLAAWIGARGIERAMERFRRARSDTTRWFLAEDWEYGDLTTLGRRFLDERRLDAARAVLEAAAEAYPGSYRPYLWLSRLHTAAGHEGAATAARQRALALNPELYPEDRRAAIELRGGIPLAFRFLDRLFEDGAGAAIRSYRRTAAGSPEKVVADPLPIVQGGQQLREAGQLEEARSVFEFCVEEFEKSVPCHLGLGTLARETGDDGVARRAYGQVLAIDPGNRVAEEGLAAIDGRAGTEP